MVASIVTLAYKNSVLSDTTLSHPTHVDFMWRLLIGLGCIPGVVGLYFRLTIPETPRFTMDIERNVQQATDDVDNIFDDSFIPDPNATFSRAAGPLSSWVDFREYFGKWENGKLLLGTAYSWFAIDASVDLIFSTNLR